MSWLTRWLAIVRKHPIAVHVAVAIGIAVVIHVALLAAVGAPPPVLGFLAVEPIVVLCSFAAPVLLTLLAIRPQLRSIVGVATSGPAVASPVLLRFVTQELNELADTIIDLRTQGMELDASTASEWVRTRCFDVTLGAYLAVDVTVPSLFMERYSEYLRSQAQYLRRTQRVDSTRVNMAASTHLEADRHSHPDAYREFTEWHRTHDVRLEHLDAARAQFLARRHRLGRITGVGLWVSEIAVLWEDDRNLIRVQMAFVGEPVYERCVAFFKDVLEESEGFPHM